MKKKDTIAESTSLLTSYREKILWGSALAILMAIFLSLFLSRPFLELLQNQELQSAMFLFGMIMISVCVVSYAFVSRPKTIELLLVFGVVVVYLLLFLRLGLPERSHLIEYSVLSLTIHQALLERKKHGRKVPFLHFLAFGLTCAVGILDEVIQKFIPNRVFDINDIIFNGLAAFMAIGVSSGLRWFRGKMTTE